MSNPYLQATFLTDGSVFFWCATTDVDHAAARELPEVLTAGARGRRAVVSPNAPHLRVQASGYTVSLVDGVRLLSRVPHDAVVTDSVRVLCHASQLGLELAAQKRVVPTVTSGSASWRVLITRRPDRDRFHALVRAMPTITRASPTRSRGAVRLRTAEATLRTFLDHTVDAMYRQAAYPGTTRGWVLELAEALRGKRRTFAPRDARFQGVPQLLAEWSGGQDTVGLRVGLRVTASDPTTSAPPPEDAPFEVQFFVHSADTPAHRAPAATAWAAGAALTLGETSYPAPAFATLRGLARASRVYPPLAAALAGSSPRALRWQADETWRFLTVGMPALRDAGVEIDLPSALEASSRERLHVRIRIGLDEAPGEDLVPLTDLASALRLRWEVVIGDDVVQRDDFAALVAQRTPIQRFRDRWVVIDPAELARLPDGLSQTGDMDPSEALRAVITGSHDGVPVHVDSRLEIVLNALRSPPPQPVPDSLNATLRPYQRRGFSWLTTLGQLGLGACLADDMGLGKTLQLITHVLHRRDRAQGASLVVCPTSVLGNWEREITRFAPTLSVGRYHGLARQEADLHNVDVVITTYGLLVRDIDLLAEITWDVVALDEAQAIKNPDSQRARSANRLVAAHRVALSGTPVENGLMELWSLMAFLVPGLLGPRARFKRAVVIPVERFGDTAVADTLRTGVAPFLLRRLKTDPLVITDLPDKIERRAWACLTQEQRSLYTQVVETCMEDIAAADPQHRRGQVLAMLTALKQVCNHPAQYLKETGPLPDRSGKLTVALSLLSDALARGEHCLVFTQYRRMGELLQQEVARAFGLTLPFLHGGTPVHHREELVRAFQEDDQAPPILLISLRAGGTGLNLTRATQVIHYDRWWNPAVEDQATDRAYRIGQRRNVLVHKMITNDTLEERIDRLLEDKRALANAVVQSGENLVATLDNDALRRLVALSDASQDDGEPT